MKRTSGRTSAASVPLDDAESSSSKLLVQCQVSMVGLDTITMASTIACARDLFESGIITTEDIIEEIF